MRLIIEYDPWAETSEAFRAANDLKLLGIPVTLREVRPTSSRVAVELSDASKAADRLAESFTKRLPPQGGSGVPRR